MAFENLKTAVAAVINANGNEEITGQILQDLINDNLIPQLGFAAIFKGLATPSTNPSVSDSNLLYYATEVGTYANFSGISITETGIYVFLKQDGVWYKNPIFTNIKKNTSLVLGGSTPPNFTNSSGSWVLQVANGSLSGSNGTVTRTNTSTVNLAIPAGNYVNVFLDLITGAITAEVGRDSNKLKDTDKYLRIGVCYPAVGIFRFECEFTVNGASHNIKLPNKQEKGKFFRFIASGVNVRFVEVANVWRLQMASGVMSMRNNVANANNSTLDLAITDSGYTYLIADVTNGNITGHTVLSEVNTLLLDTERYGLLGVVFPLYNLFDMNCPYSVNGNLLNVEIPENNSFDVDLTIDTPLFTNTLAFTDEQEIPFYKDSLFKNFDSGKKFNVVLETTLVNGRYKRYEVNNPTYLKASDFGSNTRVIFEKKQDNNKLIFKSITKVLKGVTTGLSGTINLQTIGDSIQQGNGGTISRPLDIIKTRLANYGVTVVGVGTFDMNTNIATGTPSTDTNHLGEGRGFWNYKNFVGKENTPYNQSITVATNIGSTLKFENPFLRLANATDKANNPDWCFTHGVENPTDPDGVSYTENNSYTNYYIFDYANYLTVHSVTTPDIITIGLGVNDWQESGVINIDDEFLSFVIMYQQIRAALPNVPIAIIPTQGLFQQDQTEWENEMFPLVERIIKQIETYQLTDNNLYQIPVFQHTSRYNSYKTLGTSTEISDNNNIKEAINNDVHVLDRAEPRQEYMDIMESVILKILN